MVPATKPANVLSREDHVLLTIKMKNGMLGTTEVSKVMVGTNEDLNFEIYGTEGAMKLEMMQPDFLWIYDRRDVCQTLGGTGGDKVLETINKYSESLSNCPGPRFPIGWLRGHVGCQYNFVKCIHQNTPASPSLKEAAYIQKVIETIYSGQDNLGQIV